MASSRCFCPHGSFGAFCKLLGSTACLVSEPRKLFPEKAWGFSCVQCPQAWHAAGALGMSASSQGALPPRHAGVGQWGTAS